ncbi:MAG: hypothetical protein J0G97_21085, partial [Rhizobium pusense]|nr:hypothetical protein [Agrobacterium pusense]
MGAQPFHSIDLSRQTRCIDIPVPLPRAADLLAWYDRHRRAPPWRANAGERPGPYRVWAWAA